MMLWQCFCCFFFVAWFLVSLPHVVLVVCREQSEDLEEVMMNVDTEFSAIGHAAEAAHDEDKCNLG
jgi:hypothetical protein